MLAMARVTIRCDRDGTILSRKVEALDEHEYRPVLARITEILGEDFIKWLGGKLHGTTDRKAAGATSSARSC